MHAVLGVEQTYALGDTVRFHRFGIWKKLVAGFPLTDAEVGKSFAVTSGHQPEDIDWSAFSKIDTLVVLMVGRTLAALMVLLKMEGWDPAMPVSEPIHHPSACTLPSAQSPLSAMLRGLIDQCMLSEWGSSFCPSFPRPSFGTAYPCFLHARPPPPPFPLSFCNPSCAQPPGIAAYR